MPKRVDFLVVGSGIAGLSFAIKSAEYGEVLVLTKKTKIDSNTNYAQGGVAAVFGEDDNFELHINDTLIAGDGLCHKDAVEIMVREGPKLVRELYDMGCRFSINEDGKFELGREGGHSRRRIVHAKDYTGQEIERVLTEEAKKRNIIISENEIVLDLIAKDGECLGLYYLDANSRKIESIFASATILATGGIGQVYEHTTNPPIATGDGIAMAYRIGAEIANMEFVQFHPTAVYHIKIDGRSFLISEAVRGEGGILKTIRGEPFMKKYHPLANLAPRDVVARSCIKEMIKNNDPYVLLDLTHLEPDYIKNRFPTIYETCQRWGLDITREPIPVVPAAHYLCGGIRVNTWGESSIERLFALGECACTGVHGANRLASNSLLEALVFADRAAKRIAKIKTLKLRNIPACHVASRVGPDFKIHIKQLMSKYVGLLRSEDGLLKARELLDKYYTQFGDGIHLVNTESRNMLEVARLIVECCLKRKESRGLHFVQEHPEKDDRYLKDTVVKIVKK
uniref:L-aspartate oxidase n=1 Tax=candidate division WOR-3 bacterium TaxID=2052148 RepID=A0A7C4XFV4_UNCW3